MLQPIYLHRGLTLLPGQADLRQLLSGATQLVSTAVPAASALDLDCHGSFLGDVDMSDLAPDRSVKKTTERQSRWLINTAVRTKDALAPLFSGAEAKGLYIGLGTVDCDEADEQAFLASCTTQDLSDHKLTHNNPMVGLILLNTTATSHISQMCQITGQNCCFAHLQDGGANAAIEASYDLAEQRTQVALVGGGAHKITPWYLLANEQYWRSFSKLWLTEAAAFFVMSHQPSANKLLAHYRGRRGSGGDWTALIRQLALHLTEWPKHRLMQIIISGGMPEQQQIKLQLQNVAGAAKLIFIEEGCGFIGAASCAAAVNLALELLQDDVAAPDADGLDAILVLTLGPSQQFSYLLTGKQP